MVEEIKDAQVSEIKNENVEEGNPKKRKTDLYIELVLFFILGILLGIAIKTEAAKRVTIGFNDYKMKIMSQDYNINQLEAEILNKKAEEAENQAENSGAIEGGGETNPENSQEENSAQ
ncbi:MAG TPA: hypothetical protein PLK35_02735 [Candidatus Moranbacteria bacterium]|nr:hypothetical protein [Candidatus Moranbacteria bacterium]